MLIVDLPIPHSNTTPLARCTVAVTMILSTFEVLEMSTQRWALFEIMVIGLDGKNFLELNINDKWVTLKLEAF